MDTTRHFERDVKREHPESTNLEWIQRVLANPERIEVQEDGRVRHWGYIQEVDKYVRVVTLDDRVTILTAFYDRNYRRRRQRE